MLNFNICCSKRRLTRRSFGLGNTESQAHWHYDVAVIVAIVGSGTELRLRVAVFELQGDSPVAHHVQEVLKVSRVEADLNLFAGILGRDSLARLALLGGLR